MAERYSEFDFCDAYWPAFRQIDFLRAIRTYQCEIAPIWALTRPACRWCDRRASCREPTRPGRR